MLWIAVLPAWLDAGPVPSGVAVAAALTYRATGLVCHQEPARSFHRGGWPLPVCARCTGLYAGAVFGGLVGLFAVRRTRAGGTVWPVPLSTVRVVLVLSLVPTAFLWGSEWLGHLPVGNLTRWGGAVPAGAAVSWLIVIALGGSRLTDRSPSSGVH